MTKIKAKVLPLQGKYYGTEIQVEYGNPIKVGHITVWFSSPDFIPSDNELRAAGVTREQFDADVEVEDGWGGYAPISRAELFDYSHYQSQFDLAIANCIAEALDGWEYGQAVGR